MQRPTEFDQRFARQPTSYLAQAILAKSFRMADIIVGKYPEILESQVVFIVPPYLDNDSPRSDDLGAGSYLLKFDTEPIPEFLSLIKYILFVGSYHSCRYIFHILLNTRNGGASSRQGMSAAHQSATLDTEAGRTGWSGLKLRNEEYHIMLTGLIKDNREDRYPLWSVVSSQAAQGHSTDWYYLRLALFYANNRAVKELLRCGWSVNGPSWAYFMTPLLLATRLVTSQNLVLPSLDIARKKGYGKYPPTSQRNTPTDYSFSELFNERYSHRLTNLQENIKTLKQNGAYAPALALVENDGFWVWFWLFYFLLYFLVLPLAVGFATHIRGLARPQVVGWMYAYAVLATLLPPLRVLLSIQAVWHQPTPNRFHWLASYIVLPVLWLSNNIGLVLFLFYLPSMLLIYVCMAGLISALGILHSIPWDFKR